MSQFERIKSYYSRRSVALTLEGWYYLFVLLFIAGGAILQQVNPLFVLASLMIAPLLFTWRISMTSTNRLRVRRMMPKQISAGEMLTIELQLENRRQRFDTHTLRLVDRVTLIDPPERGQVAITELFVPKLSVGEQAIVSYRAHLMRRGRYRFGPLRFSTRFPTGLVESTRFYRKPDELVVGPQIGMLSRAWHDLVYRKFTGTHQTVNQSGLHDGDFYALRDWRSGDSRRWIHWRSTARTGQLMVKQFEQQSERDFSIILCLWQDDPQNETQTENVELAASLGATAVLQAAHQSSGNVTVGVVGRTNHCLSSHSTPSFLSEVINCLAVAQSAERVDMNRVLQDTLRHSGADSPVVLITTKAMDRDELIRNAAQAQSSDADSAKHVAGFDVDSVRARMVVVSVEDRNELEQLFQLNKAPIDDAKPVAEQGSGEER